MGFNPFSWFKSAVRGIASLFKRIDRKKVKAVFKTIDEMADLGLYAAGVAAKVLTPGNPLDDLAVEALRNLKLTVKDVIETADKHAQNGRLQAIAVEVFKSKLRELIIGGEKFQFGSFVVDSVEKISGIDPAVLGAAASKGWAAFKTGAASLK